MQPLKSLGPQSLGGGSRAENKAPEGPHPHASLIGNWRLAVTLRQPLDLRRCSRDELDAFIHAADDLATIGQSHKGVKLVQLPDCAHDLSDIDGLAAALNRLGAPVQMPRTPSQATRIDLRALRGLDVTVDPGESRTQALTVVHNGLQISYVGRLGLPAPKLKKFADGRYELQFEADAARPAKADDASDRKTELRDDPSGADPQLDSKQPQPIADSHSPDPEALPIEAALRGLHVDEAQLDMTRLSSLDQCPTLLERLKNDRYADCGAIKSVRLPAGMFDLAEFAPFFKRLGKPLFVGTPHAKQPNLDLRGLGSKVPVHIEYDSTRRTDWEILVDKDTLVDFYDRSKAGVSPQARSIGGKVLVADGFKKIALEGRNASRALHTTKLQDAALTLCRRVLKARPAITREGLRTLEAMFLHVMDSRFAVDLKGNARRAAVIDLTTGAVNETSDAYDKQGLVLDLRKFPPDAIAISGLNDPYVAAKFRKFVKEASLAHSSRLLDRRVVKENQRHELNGIICPPSMTRLEPGIDHLLRGTRMQSFIEVSPCPGETNLLTLDPSVQVQVSDYASVAWPFVLRVEEGARVVLPKCGVKVWDGKRDINPAFVAKGRLGASEPLVGEPGVRTAIRFPNGLISLPPHDSRNYPKNADAPLPAGQMLQTFKSELLEANLDLSNPGHLTLTQDMLSELMTEDVMRALGAATRKWIAHERHRWELGFIPSNVARRMLGFTISELTYRAQMEARDQLPESRESLGGGALQVPPSLRPGFSFDDPDELWVPPRSNPPRTRTLSGNPGLLEGADIESLWQAHLALGRGRGGPRTSEIERHLANLIIEFMGPRNQPKRAQFVEIIDLFARPIGSTNPELIANCRASSLEWRNAELQKKEEPLDKARELVIELMQAARWTISDGDLYSYTLPLPDGKGIGAEPPVGPVPVASRQPEQHDADAPDVAEVRESKMQSPDDLPQIGEGDAAAHPDDEDALKWQHEEWPRIKRRVQKFVSRLLAAELNDRPIHQRYFAVMERVDPSKASSRSKQSNLDWLKDLYELSSDLLSDPLQQWMKDLLAQPFVDERMVKAACARIEWEFAYKASLDIDRYVLKDGKEAMLTELPQGAVRYVRQPRWIPHEDAVIEPPPLRDDDEPSAQEEVIPLGEAAGDPPPGDPVPQPATP